MKINRFSLALIFIISIFSCNTEKRIEKRQKIFDNIGKKWLQLHPCSNDSSFIYIPGKRDSILIEVPIIVIDTNYANHIIDSLNKITEQKTNGCKLEIKQAYNLGYNQSDNNWKIKISKIKVPLPIIDTLKITLKDRQQLKILESDLMEANKELMNCKDQNNKSDKWFWLFIIACMFLITSIYFNIRK
jgi:hypothetical protein